MQVYAVIIVETGKVLYIYSTKEKADAYVASQSKPAYYLVRAYTVR